MKASVDLIAIYCFLGLAVLGGGKHWNGFIWLIYGLIFPIHAVLVIVFKDWARPCANMLTHQTFWSVVLALFILWVMNSNWFSP